MPPTRAVPVRYRPVAWFSCRLDEVLLHEGPEVAGTERAAGSSNITREVEFASNKRRRSFW